MPQRPLDYQRIPPSAKTTGRRFWVILWLSLIMGGPLLAFGIWLFFVLRWF